MALDVKKQKALKKAIEELKRGGAPARGTVKKIRIENSRAYLAIDHRALGERAGGLSLYIVDENGQSKPLSMATYGAATATNSNLEKAWSVASEKAYNLVTRLLQTDYLG